MELDFARQKALNFINQDFDLSSLNDSVIILDNKTTKVDDGWVFYYNSKKFLETGDFMSMLMGNKPVFVSKSTENICYIRGDIALEDAIAEVYK